MPSVTTVFRVIVMIATGVIVVKGWQLYGPSTEQVKTFAVAALEKAQTALNGAGQPAANSPAPIVDPRAAAPPPVAPPIAAQALPMSAAPIQSAPQLVPLPNAVGGPAAAPEGSTVTKLLAQLEDMGAADAQVAPWGSSGELYRCCCRAKLEETSLLARHFEAVAAEPTAAVEQVVAKVEAWRTEQQSLLR